MKKTLTSMLGALACLILAYWLIANSNSRAAYLSYLFAAIAAIFGLVLLYRGLAMTGVGECPSCDMYLLGISAQTNEGVLCQSCGQYVEGENGELMLTPDDRVASYPLFRTEIPEQPRWPDGCCVCGQAATRSLEAKLVEERDGSMGRNVAVGVASLGVLKTVERMTHSIAVPHCEEHSDGAVLESAVESDMLNPAIAFRSHGYLKRFCQLNGTQPRC